MDRDLFAERDGTYTSYERRVQYYPAAIMPLGDCKPDWQILTLLANELDQTWLDRVRTTLGAKPIIYTSPNFWETAMGDTTQFADEGYRLLWIAHWDVPEPSVPRTRGNRGRRPSGDHPPRMSASQLPTPAV